MTELQDDVMATVANRYSRRAASTHRRSLRFRERAYWQAAGANRLALPRSRGSNMQRQLRRTIIKGAASEAGGTVVLATADASFGGLDA